MPEILRAKEAFTAPGPTDVAKGDLFNSDDPIVSGREHLFAPVAADVRASVPGTPVSPAPAVAGSDGPKVKRTAKAEDAGD
jgi:hypothetical protein